MLKPLPSEPSSHQRKDSQKIKIKKSSSNKNYKTKKHKDYKSEQKQLLKVGHSLKALGKFPEKFPTHQFKLLIDETKNVLYTIKRIELNLRLKKNKKKRTK